MKSGDFSLQLVNAATKEPLKEFTAPDDGKVYVEAEPDFEYFIRCHRHAGPTDIETTVHFEVDDTSLDYDYHFYDKPLSDLLGLLKMQNGVDTYRALKFRKKRRTPGNEVAPVGRIKAAFYETITLEDTVVHGDYDCTECLDQAFASSSPVACSDDKVFTSVAGSAIVPAINDKVRRDSRLKQRGRCLGEMTLYYISTIGLSQLGILAPIVPASPRSSHTSNSGFGAVAKANRKRARVEKSAVRRVVSPFGTRRDDHIDHSTGVVTRTYELI